MASLQVKQRIDLCAYLPTKLVPHIQPLMKLAFLEPCDDGDYIDYYRRYEGVKILDNGLIEFGKSITPTGLMEYARAVDATFIIPPDKIGNWEYNSEQALKFMFDNHLSPKRILPCLGGPYVGDWLEQVGTCIAHSFGGMCLPFRTNRFPVRAALGSRLHLLGLKWPEDFKSYLRLNGAGVNLSLDTTEFVNAAYDAKLYNEDGFTTTQRSSGYKDMPATKGVLHSVLANFKWLQEKMTLYENE